jgi:CubicO group peptidase (beta-lactamase class C family)
MFKKGAAILIAALLFLSHSFFVFAEQTSPAASGETTPSGIPLSGLEAFVDDYMKKYIGQSTSGASVVIAKDQQIVLSKGYGYADIENQLPMEPQKTVLEWGSISKLIVWTAVMQLVEKGDMELQADIRAYLPPDFLTKLKFDEPITMLNLMNHNAGFEEYMFDMAYQSPNDVRSLEDGLLLAQPAQVYKPGEVVAYSNFGNSLAAYIVERITGQKFNEYADEHIFSKLAMNDSSVLSTLEDRPDLIARKSKGYFYSGPASFTPGSWNYMSMYPNGGNNGTAEDLAKFAMAFMPAEGERSALFDQPGTLSEMLASSYSVDADMPGIAHGFWEYAGEHKGMGHGGNTIAFSSQLQIVPEDHFAIVILTNQAGETDIVHGLTKALLGQRKPEALTNDLPDSSELAGSYIAARRPFYGFMNLYSYLTLLKIVPKGTNEIQLSIAGMTADYKQTKPFLYEKVGGDTALDSWLALHFKVEGHQVAKMTTYTTDYLPLPANKSAPVLIASAVLAIISIAYVILTPLVWIVQALLHRKRNKRTAWTETGLKKYVVMLTLTGSAVIVNIAILALRMLSNYERAYSEIIIHIIANYALTALAILFIVLLLRQLTLKKQLLSRGQKFLAIVPVIIMIILILLLVFWQFYS